MSMSFSFFIIVCLSVEIIVFILALISNLDFMVLQNILLSHHWQLQLQSLVITILWWSEMPVSKAIDFIRCFAMLGIIRLLLVGVSPLQQVGFLMRCSIGKTHWNFVIECYHRLHIQTTKKNTIFVQSIIESNCIAKLI